QGRRAKRMACIRADRASVTSRACASVTLDDEHSGSHRCLTSSALRVKARELRWPTMPQIQHELKIRATPESIRKALVSADAVRAWHGGKVTANHQELRLSFADAPTFRWRVVDDATHDRVTWKCVEGPSDAVGTEARFSILP